MRLLLLLCALAVTSLAQRASINQDVLTYISYRRYSQFINLVNQAGLTDTLNGAGPFTVLAPSNTALRRVDSSILNDPAKLKSFIQYHVLNGNYTHSDFYNERQIDTLSGQKVRLNHYAIAGTYTAEGQRITSFDHRTGNGIVHLVNTVMMPPTGSVLDIIKGHTNLTTLAQAFSSASLEQFASDQHPITLFAPTDAAFAALGQDVVAGLIQNPTLLTAILNYHMIPGTLYKAGYHPDTLHTFEETDKIKLHKFLFFGYEFDNASEVGTEISATNGVVHLVDHVLIPAAYAAQVKALGGSSTATTTALP